MGSRIAIIAGSGHFPFHVAEEAQRQGLHVVVLGLQGWADPALAAHADSYEELPVGQLRQLIDALKRHRVSQAIMAGKVTKAVLFEGRVSFDAETLGLLGRASDRSVGALLGAVGQRLADEGVALVDSSSFLKSKLCPLGVLTSRPPTDKESEDIRIGERAARWLASLDIGQTAVVKERVVVALEALEGTDATIRRAHALAPGQLVVVKVAATNQDRRFDLPIVGPTTLAVLRESEVSCLALEAGAALLLEREAVIAQANAAHLCLVGIAASSGA